MNAPPEELVRGVALLRQGDLAGARRAAEMALRKQPRHPGVLQLLGVICCQSGETAKGAELLRESLRLDPSSATTRLNLAKALLALGRGAEAETVCAGGPGPELARMRGDICKAQHRLDDAVAAYRQALAQKPDFFEAWNNLGNTLRERGEHGGAVEAFQRAVALRPDNAVCRLNLGRALNSAQRFEEAIAAFDGAVRLDPGLADALFELGTTLAATGRHEESLAPLQAAARLDATDARPLAYLGLSLVALERVEEAEAVYRRALAVGPGTVEPCLFFGLLLEESNRLAELEDLVRAAERHGVRREEIAVLHAKLLKRRGDPEAALRVLESGTGAHAVNATLHAQLRGEISDRLGATDEAFRAFSEMNRLRAAEPGARRIDRARYRQHVERLTRITTPDWVGAWRPAQVDTARPAPVFLVGFPRSGTTLLDTILLGHPQTFVLEEAPLLSRVAQRAGDPAALGALDGAQLNALRAAYFAGLDALPGAAGASHVIDKSPLHLTLAAFIHRVFPDAKFIFALRHPCDVVLSCFMQNLWVNDVGVNFLDVRDAAVLYDRVMGYWTRCRELLPLAVHTLRYEALVADTEGEVRALLAFLGLPWDDAVLDNRRTALERGHIGTPSYSQVTEGIYTRSAGRWERYRTHMAEALPVLAPWVERFGYAAL
jgi:tetratricopeptide (TPR) repeat protein